MPPRFADLLGFMGSGSPELEASLTLGHCIIPFLFTLVVQIGTMQCFYCPQKDAGIRCPPLIKLCFGTSILMPVRGQFANFVFALHGPVRSSAAVLRAAHQQAPNQWIPDSETAIAVIPTADVHCLRNLCAFVSVCLCSLSAFAGWVQCQRSVLLLLFIFL